MKSLKTFLILAVAFCFTTMNAFAAFKADARTKRIPEGTMFKLEFLQPVSTFSGSAGDSFVATLLNDQTSGTSVVLPAGTIVRGSVADVNTAKRFSRGGTVDRIYVAINYTLMQDYRHTF